MTLVIVFANTDLMAVNVISVKKDSQATNVMNANQISLVMTVINASPIISIIHCVRVVSTKGTENLGSIGLFGQVFQGG